MSDIGLELRDGVAIASFNRPERLNAFRRETYAELLALVQRLEREPGWRAIVLTGTGRAFCAGQDLDDIAGMDASREELTIAVDGIQEITRTLANSAKPSVCAINGVAVGFGMECTLATDLRLAAPAAYFMLPELRHGLFHTNGTYHYLPALVGVGIATDMILTGRRVEAAEALAVGLISRIVEATELVSSAVALARSLADLDPRALRWARRGLRDPALRSTLDHALEFEAAACIDLLTQVKSLK